MAPIALAAPDPVGRMAPLPLCRPDGILLVVVAEPPLQANPQEWENLTLLRLPLEHYLVDVMDPKAKCIAAILLGMRHALEHALYPPPLVWLDAAGAETAATPLLIPPLPLDVTWAVLRVALPHGLLTTIRTPLMQVSAVSERPRSYATTAFGAIPMLRQTVAFRRLVASLVNRPRRMELQPSLIPLVL